MPGSLEEQIGSDRFCIKPHVGCLGGGVFRLLPEGCSCSYLALEVCEGWAKGGKPKLGRHLAKEYKKVGQPDPDARYDGTLELIYACWVTGEGFIEPFGESRQV